MTKYMAEDVVDRQRAMMRGGLGDDEPFDLDEMVHPQLFRDFCEGALSGGPTMDDQR